MLSVTNTKSTRRKWNYHVFMAEVDLLHESKYDYSFNNEKTVTGTESYLKIRCKQCNDIWNCKFGHHLYDKSGCRKCALKRIGREAAWNLQKFLVASESIHGRNFDYSRVREEHITGSYSNVPLACNICDYEWAPTITNHINNKQGCPNCYGNAPYTLERFLQKARKIHGDLYDYSMIREDHIHNNESKVPILCRICGKIWETTINHHINHKTGCRVCSNHEPITLEIFRQKAKDIHGDLYDYSMVKEEHVQTTKCKVPVICRICNDFWSPSINDHIYHKTGCPKCRRSKGELGCENALKILKIVYQAQVELSALPLKKYDFFFIFQDKYYLLEFDGQQHFEYTAFFHQNEENFQYRQRVDIEKTYVALHSGYRLIRIDHTQINNIEHHIRCAVNSLTDTHPLYTSNKPMYKYILDALGAV